MNGIERSDQRVSAIDRVEPVSSAQVVDIDRLRGIPDPSDWTALRPSVQSIPVSDIDRFRGLVYEPPMGGYVDAQSVFANPAQTVRDPAVTDSLNSGATPADRIAATLMHIKGIRGL